jgi:acetyl-CoA synthetase
MLLYFTSGTTARAKLVVHTHASYPIGHLSTMYGIGLRPGDTHLNISSPGWAKHAWSSFFAPWNAGAAIIALASRFEPRAALDVLVEHQVTTFCAPPTVWRMLVQHDLKHWKVALREVVAAGEPLNPEVIEQVRRAWGLTVRDFYGQTETTMIVGNSPGQRIVPGSMGRPSPGYRIALLDAEGLEADSGEIAISLHPRPVGLMRGYQDEAGGLKPIEGEYYRTGDVASRDADGYITFMGRADDVFKSSDYRLSPFELESVLIEHDAVAEAAVVPAPDSVRYTIAKGYIALAQGHAPDRATAAAIFRHMRARVSAYKLVRRIEFFELPKTISGKIRRVELRQREAKLAERGERAEAEFRIEDFPEG